VLLRQGLLEGTVVLTVPATPLAAACDALGAEVVALEAPPLDEEATAAAVPARADALVVDAAARGESLSHALDAAWCAVRAAVTAAFIPAGRGKIVLVAPRPDAVEHAPALRAGLENLARTSSIEWARYAITPTAILPGPRTSDDEVGELVAYLVSPAGDYFAGCSFDLQ